MTSKLNLLYKLPVIFVDDNKNELFSGIKKFKLSFEEDTINLIGVEGDKLVNLPYLKLLVTNVPAPGILLKLAILVSTPTKLLFVRVSIKLEPLTFVGPNQLEDNVIISPVSYFMPGFITIIESMVSSEDIDTVKVAPEPDPFVVEEMLS